MKLAIENTSDIVEINGRRARIWIGHDEHGVPVQCFIWAVSPQTHDVAVNDRFARELVEIEEPTIEEGNAA